ncbi:6601_t:CDS:2 [Funneliformis mosseae]|uniref:6601_t:CDS:1 n=1 Tax=Funneliformis mosseae TaxID=27381 RepID=A0A9N8ZDP4_FUNMO|nr:6601_t:CDS:2 [Funneliformis mosseae]
MGFIFEDIGLKHVDEYYKVSECGINIDNVPQIGDSILNLSLDFSGYIDMISKNDSRNARLDALNVCPSISPLQKLNIKVQNEIILTS